MIVGRDQKIVIVGAGLVGSLLAVMLGKRGYQIDLYEKRGDARKVDADSGRSINLALSSRGIEALSQAGLYEKVKPLLIPMRGRMLHQADGSEVFSRYGQRDHEVIYSVPRDELNKLMVNEAVIDEPVNVHFDWACLEVDFEQQIVRFESTVDGTIKEEAFDLIIGADGAGSRVRREVIRANGGESSSEFLQHDYKELEIPAAEKGSASEASWQIEKEALHIWPRGGFMLIALPNLDGSFTVTLFLHQQGDPSFESLVDNDSVEEFFRAQFPSAIPLIPNLLQEWNDNPAGRLGTVRCSPWHVKNCGLILGDASHAIVPFHGQGMNSGFEDCSELLRLLDEFEDDWSSVLSAFSQQRKPNADAIADMAIENHGTMQKGVIDPKFHLKKEVGFELERRYPETFIPRYSRVMFHNIPYAEAQRLGGIQSEILGQLVESAAAIEDVDFDLADRMIKERLAG